MIRINLLPREEKGSHREIQIPVKIADIAIPVAVLAVLSAVIGGTIVLQRAQVDKLQRDIAQVEAESRKLAPQIERVNRLAAERAELDLRLGIIAKLEVGRNSGVRLMDELAMSVPDHLWLTTVTQDGTSLTIEGNTFSNLVVSEFMSRLERSPWFSSVELEIAERAAAGEKEITRFRIGCQITPNETAN